MPIDITDKHIRIQMKDPGLFLPDSFRTVVLSAEKGIEAVMGKLKSNPNGLLVIQTYLFDRQKWPFTKARTWVEEHKAAPCWVECPMVCQASNFPVGRAIGLAVKGEGEGVLLPVTAAITLGTGQITLTGQMGDVMEEAARVAVSLLKSRVREDLSRHDFHIHLPPGGQGKDGPSAGLPMFLSLWSAWDKRPLPSYMSFTGEIDLNGNVRRVGGIVDKAEAAYMAGLGAMVMPRGNMEDMPNFSIQFHFVETVEEALVIIAGDRGQGIGNREQETDKESSAAGGPEKEESAVDKLKLIKALGLKEDSSEEAILQSVEAQKKKVEEQDRLLASAPKPETLEAMKVVEAKVSILEKALEGSEGRVGALETELRKGKIDALIAQSKKDGKITPATEAEWRKIAEKDFPWAENLLAKKAPEVPTDRLSVKTEKGQEVSITDSQSKINRMLGISNEVFAKYSAKGGEN